MSRAISQTSTTSGASTTGLARSVSVKTNSKPAVSNPLPPSDISLFVSNLRLLDLDRRPDWPNIAVQTFSAKSADQKQRIAATEWALFRLFEIWDPAETSQKLQPFFPPLEPLQSRNLRIALHRSLDALKKDGFLGREAVLRKTMLDECKGDKFFEVLALFSAIVLRKVLASQPKPATRPAAARQLATATSLSGQAQASLLPLAIAHKAALTNILRKKEEKRRKFADFGDLLDAKADDINQRIRKCAATPRSHKPAIPQKEADAIKKQLRDNWIGDQRWLDVMLHGGNIQTDAAFLNSSFKRVWQVVEQGGRLEDAVPEVGLLESLQSRVEEQQARLQKWKDFQEKMQKEVAATEEKPRRAPASMKEFRFDAHLPLQLPSKIPESESVKRRELPSEFQDILFAMDDELSRAASARYNHASTAPPVRRGSSFDISRPPVRHRKSRSDAMPKKVPSLSETTTPVLPSKKRSVDVVPTVQIRHEEPPLATPIDSEATLVGQASTFPTAASTSQTIESPMGQATEIEPIYHDADTPPSTGFVRTYPEITHMEPEQAPRPFEPPSPSPSPPPPSSYLPSEPPVLEPPSLSAEEALAAQIVSTIGDATPSPVKKPHPRLSLMERTRMSMVRTSSFDPVPESPALPSPPLPEPPTVDTTQLDGRASLLERTRLSMAAMTSQPRASLAPKEKRKSSARQSLYPVNQFNTPAGRKSTYVIEEAGSGEKTPKEDLFSDDVDYERVFKSRPKIATSPVFGTPVVGEEEEGFEEGVTGVDLGDVDVEEDGGEGGFEREWEMSPSRRVGRGRVFG